MCDGPPPVRALGEDDVEEARAAGSGPAVRGLPVRRRDRGSGRGWRRHAHRSRPVGLPAGGAERCVGRVEGVRGVRNKIGVPSSALPADLLRAAVEGVLVRHALARAHRCEVTTGPDGQIRVAGLTTTTAERQEIDRLLRFWSGRPPCPDRTSFGGRGMVTPGSTPRNAPGP